MRGAQADRPTPPGSFPPRRWAPLGPAAGDGDQRQLKPRGRHARPESLSVRCEFRHPVTSGPENSTRHLPERSPFRDDEPRSRLREAPGDVPGPRSAASPHHSASLLSSSLQRRAAPTRQAETNPSGADLQQQPTVPTQKALLPSFHLGALGNVGGAPRLPPGWGKKGVRVRQSARCPVLSAEDGSRGGCGGWAVCGAAAGG